MKFKFKQAYLTDLYTQGEASKYAKRFGPEVVRGFLKVMARIRAATDERDLRAQVALNYEPLLGPRQGQNSLRINKKWRLIVERQQAPDGTCLLIVDIEDYH